MNHQWKSADAKGKERLMQLVNSGMPVFTRIAESEASYVAQKLGDQIKLLDSYFASWDDAWREVAEWQFEIEFIDPLPEPKVDQKIELIQQMCYDAWIEAGKNWQSSDFQGKFMDWWRSNIDVIESKLIDLEKL